MSSDTLTVTEQNCTYIAGYLHIQIVTNETCELTLLHTHVKPTRKANPAIQEPGMKTHRWIYSMTEIRTVLQDTPGAMQIHQYTFPFPQRNDTIYYTVLYTGLPDTTSPQAPIFAARVPLTQLYQELWPSFPPDDNWSSISNPPDSTVTSQPGRVALTDYGGPAGGAEIVDFNVSRHPPAGPSARGLFLFYDGIYSERNNALDPAYYIHHFIVEPDFSTLIETFNYGSISEDPCTFFPPFFTGNFEPHDPWLECIDLQINRPQDLCGNAMPTWADPRVYLSAVTLGSFAPAPSSTPNVAALRPYAVYQLAGPMQDISRRWRYLIPLVPQGSSPNLVQRP